MLIWQRHWCTWVKCNKSRLLPYIWFEFAIRIQPSCELKDHIFLPTQRYPLENCQFCGSDTKSHPLGRFWEKTSSFGHLKGEVTSLTSQARDASFVISPARLFAHFCTARHCLCQMSVKSVGIVLTIKYTHLPRFWSKGKFIWTSHNFSTGADSKHPRHPGREFCSLEGGPATTCWKNSSLELIKASRRDKVLVSL